MIPLPGETAGEWWEHTGWEEARVAAARRGGYPVAFDLDTYFLHDVPKRIAERLASHGRDEAEIAFREPAAFERWPDLPIHVVAGKHDRFFPAAFQAKVARERLGRAAHEIPGGHLVALSRPRELAELLLSLVAESRSPGRRRRASAAREKSTVSRPASHPARGPSRPRRTP
jgi:pimeloyl-ACP methyl ester carboxylesterase